MGIDYAETQYYLHHFRSQGCHPEIIANTEGIFNLCLFMVGEVDRLALEIEKKTFAENHDR